MAIRLPKIRGILAALRGTKAEKPPQLVERAERFGVRGSLIYRPTGGLTWYKGTIENLSLTGVLFRGEKAVPEACPIEMSLTLQQGNPLKTGVSLYCWGKTVRTVMPVTSDGRPAFAVKILRYQSEARPAPPIRFKSAA